MKNKQLLPKTKINQNVGYAIVHLPLKIKHTLTINVEKDIAILAYIWFTPYKSKCSITKINNSSPSIKL